MLSLDQGSECGLIYRKWFSFVMNLIRNYSLSYRSESKINITKKKRDQKWDVESVLQIKYKKNISKTIRIRCRGIILYALLIELFCQSTLYCYPICEWKKKTLENSNWFLDYYSWYEKLAKAFRFVITNQYLCSLT